MPAKKYLPLLLGAATAVLALGAPAKADDVQDLKNQVKVLNDRVNQLEGQGAQPTAPSGKAPGWGTGPSVLQDLRAGEPVRLYETDETSVRLYALLEGTIIYRTNTNTLGQNSVGMRVAWFSGNRWGFRAAQLLDSSSGLRIIGKLESEFELPTGNMDTPGVLFNRDAWIGFESPAMGKLTFGRQNTLPRDFTGIYGDPYGPATIGYEECCYTNTNNFKDLIFYSGGGRSSNGDGTSRFGTTRLDNGIVWKKIFGNGLAAGLAYAFGDRTTSGGGAGGVPGGGLSTGSTQSAALGYNGGLFNLATFYNHTNVLKDGTSEGLGHQSTGIGGNVNFGIVRWNLGYFYYWADQGALGTRHDHAYTTSFRIAPPGKLDYEVGYQVMRAINAARNGADNTLVAYADASGSTTAGTGNRNTLYGSIIFHPIRSVDIYLVADYLHTTHGYHAVQAAGHDNQVEVGTGVRWKF